MARSRPRLRARRRLLVPEGEDIEDELRRLLRDREVSKVHVRTVPPQCYLFSVTMNTREQPPTDEGGISSTSATVAPDYSLPGELAPSDPVRMVAAMNVTALRSRIACCDWDL